MIKPSFELEVSASINGISNIESNMEQVKNQALQICDWYKSLVITNEMLDDIKKEKAEINKAKSSVAEYRKNIVKEFKKPIEQFESLAKETEKILSEAYDTCNESVKRYEDEQKALKSKELEEYFNEYAKSLVIDFVKYEQANINVTLTASLKSLKEQAKTFLDKINDDLMLIAAENEELVAEMMVEYKKTLNVSNSILSVKQRHKALEEERKRQEALKEFKAQEEKVIEKVEEVIAPKEIVEEKTYKATFTVIGTVNQIKSLKDFMDKEGIKYDSQK
ncbi:MAG: DUF1351 domain-containing protein [Erysipelotrichaceae bacterium]|nr:DUF1351 domain-containing protein [Erysipelotrichaceae bacterium]